jgi:hypothetical protein
MPVKVQWLTFSTRARGVPILATRELGIAARQHIVVAHGDDRFIRLSRPGASPVTVRATDLFKENEFVLPQAVPGGEVIARIEMGGIVPELYRLVGVGTTELRADGDLVLLRGVSAGRYELTPVYPGGVSGRARTVPIADGASTPFYILAENVGAVQVEATGQVCREAASLRITRVDAKSSAIGTVTTRRDVARIALDGTCSHTIGGLVPGRYEASYNGSSGTVGAGVFAIERGALASVIVASPTARVFGRVFINGAAGEDVTVTLVRASGELDNQGTQTVSDAQGFYEMTLAKPGAFQVSFKKDGIDLLGAERSARITAGDNQIDWQIRSGRLNIAVNGWDRSSPLMVTVKRLNMTEPGQTGVALRILPTDKMPVVVDGLGFEEYLIEARQHDSASSSPDKAGSASTRIENDKREASVYIELKSTERLLSIVDPEGSPVVAATVLVAMGEPLRETSPGDYSLADVAPGVHLTILARGFPPVCRAAPASPLRIQLDQGIAVRLRFSGRSDVYDRPPGQLLWAGAECPVPLSRFDYSAVAATSAGVAEFVVKAFPRAAEFVFIATPFDTPDEWQRLQIDADGVVQIRLPSGK